jgi:predicted transcriptional regulator
MRGTKTVALAVRIPPDLKAKLEAMAQREERTLSQFVMLLLKRAVQEEEAAEEAASEPTKARKPSTRRTTEK